MQIDNGLFKVVQCDMDQRLIFETDWVVELGSQYHPFPTWNRAWAFAFDSGYYPHSECASRILIRKLVWNARLRWIDHLLKPDTKKFVGSLENISNEKERCCLGHACNVLGAEREVLCARVTYDGSLTHLPRTIKHKLDMHNNLGGNVIRKPLLNLPHYSLSVMNDRTKATPQDIGKYLMTVIRGGESTPFKEIKL